MLCFRSTSCYFLLLLFTLSLLFFSTSGTDPFSETLSDDIETLGKANGALGWKTRGLLSKETTLNSSTMILAQERTRRKDPLDNFKPYTGGWNISNRHYWASVGFTAVPFFAIAGAWLIVFGLSLLLICMCCCCCPREPYGYSRCAYALSLMLLILFTVSAIIGCVILYTGQGKFYSSTSNTLDYVVSQANITVENLRNVSAYLAAAKLIKVDSVFLPANVQNNIDDIQHKIKSAANVLSNSAQENSKHIQDALNAVRLALIVLAAVMLFLVFVGFLFSILGLQCLVYFLVILGWILVAATFILCGVFLLLHNVVADSCVAMDEWVENPTAHTSLDDILPCVDNATAKETLLQSKDVTFQLVNVVNTVVGNVTNGNFPPSAGVPMYYNQSGPLMPPLCNPFKSDLTDRQCVASEVGLNNATEDWKKYICEVSSSGICATPGRLTPDIYKQMAAAVNVSYGLYYYGPFLVDLEDCTFVRHTFTHISNTNCPGLRRYTEWIYIGLVVVSAAVMLSLIFWVIYARERRHRVHTKQFMYRSSSPFGGDKTS